ncbi:hypothetical protein [Allobaculum fili]|uniref:hypothetical protein n=1 Tax=Allobaculum fili TaxID=2834460 RepID=UPI001E5D7900|nr:hypothetical protein [Allobaculum fili]
MKTFSFFTGRAQRKNTAQFGKAAPLRKLKAERFLLQYRIVCRPFRGVFESAQDPIAQCGFWFQRSERS